MGSVTSTATPAWPGAAGGLAENVNDIQLVSSPHLWDRSNWRINRLKSTPVFPLLVISFSLNLPRENLWEFCTVVKGFSK